VINLDRCKDRMLFFDKSNLQEEIEELRGEHQELLDDIEEHPDYEDTMESTIETAQKELKEDIEGDGLLKQGYKVELANSHKQLNRMVKEIKILKEEIEELKSLKQSEINEAVISDEGTAKLILDIAKLIGVVHEREEEIKKLTELTDGIMNEPNTSHIQGCNAYEKFIHTLVELNHDEKWITELKKEKEDLMKFIAGDYDAEPSVRKSIKEFYNQKFIKGNEERWEEVGLQFDEE